MSYWRWTRFLVFGVGVVSLWAQAPVEEGGRQLFSAGRPGSYLGVGVRDVNAARAKELSLAEEAGVEVTQVDDDSPAIAADLKVGDVVLEYNGQGVEGSEQFVRMVRETPVGRTVKLKVSRAGVLKLLTATLGQRRGGLSGRRLPEGMSWERLPGPWTSSMDLPRPLLSWRSEMIGIVAESLGGQLASYFGVKEGVLIRHVHPGSRAAKAGLRAGDVLLRVHGEMVTTPWDVTRSLRAAAGKDAISLRLVRKDREMSLEIEHPGSAPEPRPGSQTAPRSPGKN